MERDLPLSQEFTKQDIQDLNVELKVGALGVFHAAHRRTDLSKN